MMPSCVPRVTIYGLCFDGSVIYVGQTWRLVSRLSGHRNGKTKLNKDGLYPYLTPVVLARVSQRVAFATEAKFIRIFRKLGGCQFNKRIPKIKARKDPTYGPRIRHKPSGKIFPSILIASMAFGFGRSLVNNDLNRNDGEFEIV